MNGKIDILQSNHFSLRRSEGLTQVLRFEHDRSRLESIESSSDFRGLKTIIWKLDLGHVGVSSLTGVSFEAAVC